MAEQSPSSKERRNELAQLRTEKAERRTQLANEQTFSAWIRTGLAMLVAAFATARLLKGAGPAWLPTVAGLLFVALAACTFAMALISYRKTAAPSRSATQQWIVGTLVAILIALSAIGAFLIANGAQWFPSLA